MCAINPKHKKRLILDVYTTMDITAEAFHERVMRLSFLMETELNKDASLRWHLNEEKETKPELIFKREPKIRKGQKTKDEDDE